MLTVRKCRPFSTPLGIHHDNSHFSWPGEHSPIKIPSEVVRRDGCTEARSTLLLPGQLVRLAILGWSRMVLGSGVASFMEVKHYEIESVDQ